MKKLRKIPANAQIEGKIVERTSEGYELRKYCKENETYFEDVRFRQINHSLDEKLALAKTQREKKALLLEIYPTAMYVSQDCF